MKFGIYDADSVRVFKDLKGRITEQRDGFEQSGDWIYFNNCLPHRRIVKIWPGTIDYEVLELLVSLGKAAGDSKVLYDSGCNRSVSYRENAPSIKTHYFQLPLETVKYSLTIGIPREIYQGRLRGKDFEFQGADFFMSETCQWAIAYTPIAEYALFAGTDVTATAFDQWQLENDDYYSVQEFLKDLVNSGCGFRLDRMDGFYDWPLRLMIHAYGQEKAVDLMRSFDLIVH